MNWNTFIQRQPLAAEMFTKSYEKNRLAHAYLLEGAKGTGKLNAATLLIQGILCLKNENAIEPCLSCTNCIRVENGNHPDVHIITPEGQSIKKDQIVFLQQEFHKAGVESNQKFYIIEHAERMTNSAANSLLKFLEEPHSGTMAFLLTEQLHRILPTILSRCQHIPFHLIPSHLLMEDLLKSGVHSSLAPLIAQLTNDIDKGVELSQNEWFAQARRIVLKLYEVLKKDPLIAMVSLQEEWISHFKEKEQLEVGLDLLLIIYKDLFSVHVFGENAELCYPDYRDKWNADVLQISLQAITKKQEAVLESKKNIGSNMNTHLLMEQLVLNLQGESTFV